GMTGEVFGQQQVVVPTEPGTYTYTVVANDIFAGCLANSSVVVTVNELPVITSAIAVPETQCAGSDVSLQASSIISAPGVAQIGSGAATSSTTGLTPFSGVWEAGRSQYLIRASELAAEELLAGEITSLAFNITQALDWDHNGFTIMMANVAVDELGNDYLAPTWTTVYGPAIVNPASTGWLTLNFTTPFIWDGTSNVVIQVCFTNDDWDGNAGVGVTTTSF